MTEQKHIPVMSKEVLQYLLPVRGQCRIVDCTLGYGGHSSLILRKNKEAQLLGIDRDDDAISFARDELSFAAERVRIVKGNFSELPEILTKIGWEKVDRILLDIGVSSPQLDEVDRGFSHRFNGPLDMRMDRKNDKTASQILNKASIDELIHIFKDYGEINKPWKLAKAIVERRSSRPWFKTSELVELCEKVLPRPRRGGLPVPTLCFQALRIAVNDELGELKKALETAIGFLASGGRVLVLSYHSLEDRIVKNIFKKESTQCLCPPGLPVCRCGHVATLKILTKKPLRPTEEEIKLNRRASSAKMRVAEKLSVEF